MSHSIHINYFLNPYCFYFKFDNDLHNEDLQHLEDEISKYARDQIKELTEPVTVSTGDTVAAYEISWGKWVRAHVRYYDDRFKYYQLWAIDHGKLFRTGNRNVIVLPQHLIDKKVKGVARGSLYSVCPSELVSFQKICFFFFIKY